MSQLENRSDMSWVLFKNNLRLRKRAFLDWASMTFSHSSKIKISIFWHDSPETSIYWCNLSEMAILSAMIDGRYEKERHKMPNVFNRNLCVSVLWNIVLHFDADADAKLRLIEFHELHKIVAQLNGNSSTHGARAVIEKSQWVGTRDRYDSVELISMVYSSCNLFTLHNSMRFTFSLCAPKENPLSYNRQLVIRKTLSVCFSAVKERETWN